MSQFPAIYTVEPTASPHTHTIILLHGRGSNGAEFAEELFEAQTSNGQNLQEHLLGYKWVFPSSQTRYSTVFQEEMDEWFDIYSLTDPTSREELQTEGLQQSIAHIRQIIQREAVQVPLTNILLGGISQGCATAIRALLNGPQLGAFIGFCSWMPFPNNLRDITTTTAVPLDDHMNKAASRKPPSPSSYINTPVFLSHAKDDDVVDFDLGVRLRDSLVQEGMKVAWKEYEDGGHWIKEPVGFDDLIEFLALRT